jgi:hypothetical protein
MIVLVLFCLVLIVGGVGVLVLMDRARRREPEEPEQDAW